MRMLIVNPIAGCGYALKVMEQVQSVLTARNLPFRVMRTEYPGYAAKLAREAVEMGCEAVYVIGGDGTFSEAARGLAGSGIPIGLIPAGTGNDFVKTLGTPKEPMAALNFILSHEPRPCDAIDLNGQMFLNVAGAASGGSCLRRFGRRQSREAIGCCRSKPCRQGITRSMTARTPSTSAWASCRWSACRRCGMNGIRVRCMCCRCKTRNFSCQKEGISAFCGEYIEISAEKEATLWLILERQSKKSGNRA